MTANNPHARQRPINNPSLRDTNLFERMLTFANSHRATSNVLHALETWVDDLDVPGYRWIRRRHPEYELTFGKSVRGQELEIYIDYSAKNDFLGLYMYLPTLYERGAHTTVCELINKVNMDASYGNLELNPDSGKLRYRFSIDVEGVRLTHVFLDFMLASGCSVFGKCMPELLPGPKEAQ